MRRLKIAILFTPHTPHSKKAIAVLMIAFMPISTILPAQSIKLDSVAIYEQSYRQFMVQKWTADRKEFTVVNRKKWWYYLPGVGWAFGLPTVNIHTGVIAQIDRDRNVMAAKLSSLDSRYQIDFTEGLAKIRIEYRKLQIRNEQLQQERKLLDKLCGIQAIHNEAFEKQTMTPEEHLQNSYQYEKAITDWKNRDSELAVAVLDFFSLCRFEMPDTKLVELASDEGCQIRKQP
jgi:hypothetical protein